MSVIDDLSVYYYIALVLPQKMMGNVVYFHKLNERVVVVSPFIASGEVLTADWLE